MKREYEFFKEFPFFFHSETSSNPINSIAKTQKLQFAKLFSGELRLRLKTYFNN